MSAVRKTGMLLASIIALLAFCWQANACFAEHAGIVPCHEQASDSSVADDVSEGHCCHLQTTATLGQSLPTASVVLKEVGYQSLTIGAPDGPVEEIDYPPQLLS
jgi:hypothetical protein